MFLSRRDSRKKPPASFFPLHLNLNMVTLEPFDHELILLARSEARAHRFPRPAAADPTVLGLGDPDQTFLRHRVDRVVIHLVPKFKLPGHRMFAR